MERPTWLPFALTLAVFLAALKFVVPTTGLLRQGRYGATRWARGVAAFALAAYLTGAFWGVLTTWPPPTEMILFVMFLWGTGVVLMWSILLSRRRVSDVAIGTSVLLVGLASLVMGIVSWLTPGEPRWVTGFAFLLWGLGSVLYGIGLPLERATFLGAGFVLIAMGVLPPAAYTLLPESETVTGIGYMLLSLGWLLHGASLLPDRLRQGGLACLLAGGGVLLMGVIAFVTGQALYGVGFALAGAGLFFSGVWFPGTAVPDRQRPGGLGFLLVGVGALQIGLLRLLDGWEYGLGFLMIGAGGVLYGVWYLPDRLRRGGLAFSLLGVGALSLGISYLFGDPWWSAGIGFLLLGLGGLLGAVSFLFDRPRLFGGAFLVFSVSGLMLGISCLGSKSDLVEIIKGLWGLIGVALMLFGVASLMAGLALLYRLELRGPSEAVIHGPPPCPAEAGSTEA